MSAGANRSILLKPSRPAGPGITLRWFCPRCSQPRDLKGSKGQGAQKRCSECVTAKAGRAVNGR